MIYHSWGIPLVSLALGKLEILSVMHTQTHLPGAVPSYSCDISKCLIVHNISLVWEGALTTSLPYISCISAARLPRIDGDNNLRWYSQGCCLSILVTNPSQTFSPHHLQVSEAGSTKITAFITHFFPLHPATSLRNPRESHLQGTTGRMAVAQPHHKADAFENTWKNAKKEAEKWAWQRTSEPLSWVRTKSFRGQCAASTSGRTRFTPFSSQLFSAQGLCETDMVSLYSVTFFGFCFHELACSSHGNSDDPNTLQ